MKMNKDGEPAISSQIWSLLANMHREFSESLSLLLTVDDVTPLADALRAMIVEHNRLAVIQYELQSETRKGRPRKEKKVVPPTGNRLADLLWPGRVIKKPPGRPVKGGPYFDRLTFNVVEQRRAELAAKNRCKPTIKAAIDSLNADRARDQSVRVVAFVSVKHNKVRSSYRRGKLLTTRD